MTKNSKDLHTKSPKRVGGTADNTTNRGRTRYIKSTETASDSGRTEGRTASEAPRGDNSGSERDR